ncbi:MAG: hypothetical protein ACYC1Z_14410 [Georgenia sp.]
MSGVTPLPHAKDVRDLLEMMLGRDVELTVGGDAVNPASPMGFVVGVYVTEMLKTAALVALDVDAAARTGAALALIPPRAAEDAVQDGRLSESLLENVSEILNVTASLFNVDGAPHLKLYSVHDSAVGLLPADIANWLRSYGPRLDATVSVKGYGDGQVSLVVI